MSIQQQGPFVPSSLDSHRGPCSGPVPPRPPQNMKRRWGSSPKRQGSTSSTVWTTWCRSGFAFVFYVGCNPLSLTNNQPCIVYIQYVPILFCTYIVQPIVFTVNIIWIFIHSFNISVFTQLCYSIVIDFLLLTLSVYVSTSLVSLCAAVTTKWRTHVL